MCFFVLFSIYFKKNSYYLAFSDWYKIFLRLMNIVSSLKAKWEVVIFKSMCFSQGEML